jgi:hypothetical protein
VLTRRVPAVVAAVLPLLTAWSCELPQRGTVPAEEGVVVRTETQYRSQDRVVVVLTLRGDDGGEFEVTVDRDTGCAVGERYPACDR